MNVNPHVTGAATFSNLATGKRIKVAAAEIALAQVQATLALAYEQRTANLIAFSQLCVDVDTSGIYGQGYDMTEIKERLGIA